MNTFGKGLTDEEVEQGIERLRNSPDVKLARAEMRLRYKRRQKLYNLRSLEKRGKELAAAGITAEMLSSMVEDGDETEGL